MDQSPSRPVAGSGIVEGKATADLTSGDHDLVEAARRLITERYTENRHHIAAAVRGGSGRIYTGLHLDTYVGRASVCAEAVALGHALTAGETSIDAIVSVRHPRPREQHRDCKVVSPCGICREMLTDFAAGCAVILAEPDMTRPHAQSGAAGSGSPQTLKRVPVATLLPEKYRRQP
ncbi:MAG: cytidine deaminase [Dongiaceae bacterium]